MSEDLTGSRSCDNKIEMAESPPHGGGSSNAGPMNSAGEGKTTATARGESDPLFHPSGLKNRKTVIGLAPITTPVPPAISMSPAEIAEAEARKERVLGRRPSTLPLGTTIPPSGSAYPQPLPSGAPPALPLSQMISEGRLPSASGWEVHTETPSAAPVTEVMEVAPTTARMAPVVDSAPRVPSVLHQRPERSSNPIAEPPRGPGALHRSTPADPVPSTALAIRPYEPSYGRHALSGTIDPRLVLLLEPHSARATSFRLLRDSLLAKAIPRVVAVSSALPKDGKTTCAANLALALAEQSSTRVLLVDGNFFEPELAQMFTLDRLTSATPDDSASWLAPYKVVEVMPQLHVAGIVRTAGEVPHFEQHRFDAMIDRLCRVAYDYIVIDAPALRGTPAALQLLSVADGMILSVRSGVTSATDLRRAVEQLPPNKALGIALMDASQH